MAVIVARATACVANHFLKAASHLRTTATNEVLALVVSTIPAHLVMIATVVRACHLLLDEA